MCIYYMCVCVYIYVYTAYFQYTMRGIRRCYNVECTSWERHKVVEIGRLAQGKGRESFQVSQESSVVRL